MEENKKKLSAEEITKLLKTGAKKRRVSKRLIFFLLLVLFGLPVGIAAWYFWPRPGPPRLLIVAVDHLCLPGEELALQIQVGPFPGESSTRLGNWQVLMQELPLVPGAAIWQQETKTSPRGTASAQWKLSADKKFFNYVARYVPDQKELAVDRGGRIFCFPKETPLLFVDVERTLSKAEAGDWDSKNRVDIPGNKEAIKTLTQIVLKTKFELIYLACASPDLARYLKVRDWVQSVQVGGVRCPSGPVLGRLDFSPEFDEKEQLAQRFQVIQQQFIGKMMGVTANPATAAAFQSAGLQTFLIGDAEAPKGVTTVKEWGQLVKHFLN